MATPLPRQKNPPSVPVGNRSQTPPLQPHQSISTLPSAHMSDVFLQPDDNAFADIDSNEAASPSQDEADKAAYASIADVSTRGSGVYKCSFGFKCTKGGVKEGQIRIFKRNSEYRTHMMKHEKAFRCIYLGCGKSFSRLDNLKRHEAKLGHGNT